MLEHLWLDGNELVDVPDFSHLPALKSVSLSSNPIEYIKTKAFFNLTELVKVYMSDLDFLIMIEERAFSNLPKLNELQISGCQKLQFIHAGAFEDTPMLRVLDLSGNGLHTVTDLWNTLPRLELIKLEHVSNGTEFWSILNLTLTGSRCLKVNLELVKMRLFNQLDDRSKSQ